MGDLSIPINISIIEDSKENILPLAGGRSARALASALSLQTPQSKRDAHSDARAVYEKELETSAELDDPLEVWVRYVNWTIETYPSGHSSESGLIQLLERATKEFQHEIHYKNDPRYLKLWIHYIQHFSDAPREHFTFLARNDIGQRLALFYEEFAAFLERTDRWKQADEIYQMGMEKNARPMERLVRKYEEFRQRLAANPQRLDEPSSPALPLVRPALASKILPFGATTGEPSDPQAAHRAAAAMPPPPKPGRQKMAIFSDADVPAGTPNAMPSNGSPWESIGTLEHRRKENTMEPKPWVGEILKQEGGGGRAIAGDKLMIFRDTDSLFAPPPTSSLPKNTAFSNPPAPGKRPEQVVVDLESVYPDPKDPTDEYSFEELRAINRGCYGIDWRRKREDAEDQRRRDKRRVPTFEISKTPVKIQAKIHSPSPGKGKLKKRSAMMGNSEPTMTFHTRAATNEIYDILNQPLEEGEDLDGSQYDSDEDPDDVTGVTNFGDEQDEDDEDDEDARSNWSDEGTPREGKGPLGGSGIVYEDETVGLSDDTYFQKFESLQLKQGGPARQSDDDEDAEEEGDGEEEEEEEDEPELPPMLPRKLFVHGDSSPPVSKPPPQAQQQYSHVPNNRLPFMTPIVERTESIPPTTARRKASAQNAKTPCKPKDTRQADLLMSSPFQEIVNGSELDLSMPKPAAVSQLPPSATPLVQAKKQPLAPKKAALAPKPAVASSIATTTDVVPKGGSIIKEAQCNPMHDEIRKTILEKLNPPLKSYEGFYQYPESGTGKKAALDKAKGKKDHIGDLSQNVVIEFKGKVNEKGIRATGNSSYTFKKVLGKGAYAPVFLVENNSIAASSSSSPASNNDDDSNDPNSQKELLLVTETKHLNRHHLEAIKMESDPPTPWEFYIMRQAHRRLGVSRPIESIAQAHEMHLFEKEAYLVLEYRSHGSILDCINIAGEESAKGTGAMGGGMDELLAMFLTIELLRTVEGLHSKGIIHGDLKADNCLMRFDQPNSSPTDNPPLSSDDPTWSPRYKRDGSNSWNKKGITLIDFGRGVDMKAFTDNVQFVADWKIQEHQDCMEMREMRPWTYQVDYYGLANIVHLMLYGKYMEVSVVKDGVVLGPGGAKSYRIGSGFKRYWQGEIWGRLFEVLLNSGKFVKGEDRGTLPVTRALREVRTEMEGWLEENAEKGNGLRSLVRRMEGALRERRKGGGVKK